MSEIDPGAGWRLVHEGERIMEGDEVWMYGPWKPWAWTGEVYDPRYHNPVRRRVTTPGVQAVKEVDAHGRAMQEAAERKAREGHNI